MKPRTPWLPQHDAILEQYSGKLPAAQIAEMTGHCVKVIKNRARARNLPAYNHTRARKAWTRRDYLLAGAAGLAVEDSTW